MGIRRKLSNICRVLLLAASVTTLTVATAQPQDLRDLNDQILLDPQNVDLNLRYARAAEEQGRQRLALAAYERVLINHPDNEDARRGYERMRRVLEPAYRFTRTEIGARWDSNPRNFPSGEEDAYSVFARGTVVDERPLGNRRWRTIGTLEAEISPEVEELDYVYAGAQIGPLFYIAPHVAAIPSVGVGVSTLDDNYYYSEVNATVTIEGRQDGLSYWARARSGWREYGEESTAEEGAFAELSGGVSKPRILADKDSASVVPWVRWSDVEGSVYNGLNDEFAPGQYTEYGVEANYYYRANDNLVFSAGATVRDRHYSQTEIAGEERRDTSVTPEVGVSFPNVLPCSCTINVTYSHRDNSSNDPNADYDGDQVSVSLFAQF